MGQCINHPETDTRYICMKHNIYLCEECLECRDPKIYCKFRSSCPIHFITKKGFDDSLEKPLEKESAVLFNPAVRFNPDEVRIPAGEGAPIQDAA